MTERPILFSAPMVRALPDGRKTQTRRPVKPAPDWDFPEPCCSTTSEGWQGPIDRATWAESADPEMDFRRCPYGGPGDLLWVRENFRLPLTREGQKPKDCAGSPVCYEAERESYSRNGWGKLHPAIHLPRWASRITLRVTDVRVERLNACTEADALAEGVIWSDEWRGYVVPGVDHPNKDFPVLSRATAREMYAALWDTINGSGEWLANPWVWVVSFERV